MKCPNCHHVSGPTQVQCNACGKIFDRDRLEKLQHLEYMYEWLDSNLLDAKTIQSDHLRTQIARQIDAVRVSLDGPAPIPAAPAIGAPPPAASTTTAVPVKPVGPVSDGMRPLCDEIALIDGVLATLAPWVGAATVSSATSERLRAHLLSQRTDLAQLAGALPVTSESPAMAMVATYALQSLRTWEHAVPAFAGDERERLHAYLLKLAAPPVPAGAPTAAAAMAAPIQPVAPAAPTPFKGAAHAPAPVKTVPAPPRNRAPAAPPRPKRAPAPVYHLPSINWAKVGSRAWDLVVSGVLLRALLYLGAFMIVVSAAVLAIVYRESFPLPVQLAFIAAIPLAFYTGGFVLRARMASPIAGGVFTGIGALLVAVDFAAVYQLGGLGAIIDGNIYWLIASVICLAIYAFTAWRMPSEFHGYIALLGTCSLVWSMVGVMRFGLDWSIASIAASAIVMLEGSRRLRRVNQRNDLAQAAWRLPLILVPVSQALVLFVPGDVAFAQAATYMLAAIAYGILALTAKTPIFAHAAVWTPLAAVYFMQQGLRMPFEWFGSLLAVISLAYGAISYQLGRRLPQAFAQRGAFLSAIRLVNYGSLGLSFLLAAIALIFSIWACVVALTIGTLKLGTDAYLLRRPKFTLAAASLFVAPFSLAILRSLADWRVPQPDAWLMAAWGMLALAYLGVAAVPRLPAAHTRWFALWSQLLPPAAFGLLLLNFAGPYRWAALPAFAAHSLILLVYIASTLIHHRVRSEALAGWVRRMPAALQPAIFLWAVGLSLPFWLGVLWMAVGLPQSWLGAALTALALGYMAVGQWLGRRWPAYRVPFHAYAYVLPVAGIAIALGDRAALVPVLYGAVAIEAAQAAIYRRRVDAAIGALLLLWPFHLTLDTFQWPVHAVSLAQALLAALVYVPLGLALRRSQIFSRLQVPVFAVGYVLSVIAVAAGLLGPIGMVTNVPWVAVTTPLVIGILYAFSVHRFVRKPFAWAAVLVFAIAFGQALALVSVPMPYVPLAWVALAVLVVAFERGSVRTAAQPWIQLFGWPLKTAAVGLSVLGLSLTYIPSLVLIWTFRVDEAAALPVLLSQGLAIGLMVIGARLYRTRWPLYLEPALALAATTLFFVTYSRVIFGAPLGFAHYGLVWGALALLHLLVAVRVDPSKVRYAHGLYLGGYALVALAVLATLFDRSVLLWTQGLTIAVAAGSAWLVQRDRHLTWIEFVNGLFSGRQGVAYSLVRSLFLWLAAWPFADWVVQLLQALNVSGAWAWLGLGASALLLVALVPWLRRMDPVYSWPLHSASQFAMLYGLALSLPLSAAAWNALAGRHVEPAIMGQLPPLIALQLLGVVFYAAAAYVVRGRFFAHVSAWLLIVPFTLAWLVYAPALAPVQFAWPWMALAAALLAAGYALDRLSARYAHAPYLAGYALAAFAVLWSFGDLIANLYTLPAAIGLALISQALVLRGRHRAYDDFVRWIWRAKDTVAQRVAYTAFLFFAAYAFPVWLMQLFAWQQVPLPWRGVTLALAAPVYIAAGLVIRRVKAEYTWPLYSMGYALTAIGAMVTFEDERLAIVTLSLDAVVYAVSAYIFRSSVWLYLSNTLASVVVLLVLHANGLFNAPWVAGSLMSLAFLYVAGAQWFDRRAAYPAAIAPYALPFYALAYMLSALALAVASSERMLAIGVYTAGVVLYAFSAWRLREPFFLYPAVWLAIVPYHLLVTLTPLPAEWYGFSWLPLIMAEVAAGYLVFSRKALHLRPLAAAMTHPALPFYSAAYALSAAMLAGALPAVLSAPLAATLTFTAGALLYFASARLFHRAAWLYPALLVTHLTLLFALRLMPSNLPAYTMAWPFHVLTWAVALAGLVFTRGIEPSAGVRLSLGKRAIELPPSPFLQFLTASVWARPFLLFALLDVLLWQSVAQGGYDTAITVAAGSTLLIAVLAMRWLDAWLPYGALIFAAIGVGNVAAWLGLSWAQSLALAGGIGFVLYLTGWAAEWLSARINALTVWPRPLAGAAILYTVVALFSILPVAAAEPFMFALALAFAGALCLTMSYRVQNTRLSYLGMGMLELAWGLALLNRSVPQPQYYAIPAGLYFTAVGYLERRRSRPLFATLIEAFGLAVMLMTAFWQSLDVVDGFPYFVLLLAEGLALLWWGAGRRARLPFFAGIAASVLNVIAQIFVMANRYALNQYVIVFGTGILLVSVAVFVERQRARIVAHAQEWKETLEKWE